MGKNSKNSDIFPALGDIFFLSSVNNKPVEISFTAPDLSSQGGLMLLNEYEQRNGFIAKLSDCVADTRYQPFVQHSYYEMFRQRICQIAAGYKDADDSDLLRNDSILKLCSGRLPDAQALSSQPTITRLENKLTDRELYKMGEVFLDEFIASYKKPPKVIILDCDDSNFNTYGDRQGTLFNDYYGEYCYMPLFIFEGQSGKMILPLLRPGRRNKSVNIYKILRRIINRLRKVWKDTEFIVRGDAHFCCRELMDWNEDQMIASPEFIEWACNQRSIYFMTGLTGNKALSARTRDWVDMAEESFKRTGQPVRFFKTFMYQAASWKYAQRVIVKIEVNEKGKNVRYIVTNFKHNNSRFLYEEVYCGRGQMELYIKELKTYLNADTMSCNKFEANQFRLFLHAAAYVIYLGLKQNMFTGTDLQTASIQTIREKIILTAVHIRVLKTKIKIEFPEHHPYRGVLEKAFAGCAGWREAA
ncbi:MAG: IS1380 family transposase [Tannerella sp.]|jgi:hypothetical protein|nr:IS1380 family transposase [Tannerella sp.]